MEAIPSTQRGAGPRESDLRPKVLFIAASPRSGTTILGNVLNELDGWFHLGELRYLWTAGLPTPRRRCGCGEMLPECEVWRRIAATTFGDPPACGPGAEAPTLGHALAPALAEVMERTQRRLVRPWASRWILDRRGGARWAALRHYADVFGALYRGIARATGARVLVDSSKLLPDALLASAVPGIDLRYLHVVRDGRGVVTSRVKRLGSERADGTLAVPNLLALREAWRWSLGNRRMESRLRATNRPVMGLRYEDFIAEPAETVRRIAASAGESVEAVSFLDGDSVELGTNHTTNGNRNRWQTGTVKLRQDLTWHRLAAADLRRLCRAMAGALRHFGYDDSG